jgi:hypothetical protein
MSPKARFVIAALLAALAETVFLGGLVRVVAVERVVALAVAFAAGYVVLLVALHVLDRSGKGPPLGEQLRSHALVGAAALLLAELMLNFCDDVLGLPLVATNAVVLVAVAAWLAVGWPFVLGSAHACRDEPDGR